MRELCGIFSYMSFQRNYDAMRIYKGSMDIKRKFLYHLGDAFTGFDAKAIWEDTKVGLKHFTHPIYILKLCCKFNLKPFSFFSAH